ILVTHPDGSTEFLTGDATATTQELIYENAATGNWTFDIWPNEIPTVVVYDGVINGTAELCTLPFDQCFLPPPDDEGEESQPGCGAFRQGALPVGSTASMHRVRALQARLLPHGWFDLVRQVLLFFLAYNGYRLVRGMADDPGVTAAAFDHARSLIGIEK